MIPADVVGVRAHDSVSVAGGHVQVAVVADSGTLAAAREKLRSCATARKTFRAARSIAANYNIILFFVNHYRFDFYVAQGPP